MEKIIKEVAIIGAGPSGVTASIYLKRAGLDFVLFENELVGGKVNLTAEIDNYPPINHITGFELGQKYEEDLKYNDIKVTREKVIEVSKQEELFIVKTNKNEYICKAVLLASGALNKRLNVLNEEKFINKGISGCAVCDGNLFKNKPMAVVGGGNSALEEALYLATIASKVYVIHRRNEFRGAKQYLDLLKQKENVEVLTPYVISECLGDNVLTSLKLENVETKESKVIDVNVLFEYVGLVANTDYLKINEVKDNNGFIIINEDCETSVKGLFASGDVTNKKLRQIIVASGDGAMASQSIINYLHLL